MAENYGIAYERMANVASSGGGDVKIIPKGVTRGSWEFPKRRFAEECVGGRGEKASEGEEETDVGEFGE